MNIYAPAYQGNHTYGQYSKMKDEIENRLDSGQLVLDADCIFEKELKAYFYDIFCPVFIKRIEGTAVIQVKDKKTMRKIRKLLQIFIIQYGPIKMKNGKYVMYIGA